VIQIPGDVALATRQGWPAELRFLVEQYPREVWQGHGNLGEMAQFWLQRHDMFRTLGASLDDATLQFREGKIAPAAFQAWFTPRLQFFLSQLEEHHHVEDQHYFPVFRAAETRLERGFEVLEQDHDIIHAEIAASVEAANDVLKVLAGEAARTDAQASDALRRATDSYVTVGTKLLRHLTRHLGDEEDLIIPLILDRSESGLGVG
jgi:iron-sulfur cluster repair protein YtfE (RIC family)